MAERKLRFAHALLPQGWANDVAVAVSPEGLIAAVTANETDELGPTIAGFAVPGMANVHAHAHQRAMAGLAEISSTGTDSFWTWRETMYRFALAMAPAELEAVAAQLYMEALLAGFTSVGEFQYLHHAPDGSRYGRPAEMSLRCLSAAATTGIAITLLPTFYRYAGLKNQPAAASQRRFVNDAASYLGILHDVQTEVLKQGNARLGISPHSLRAVAAEELREVIEEFDRLQPDGPVHIHAAEQSREVEECLAATGKRPIEFLLGNFEVSERWCIIHATHMTESETGDLARSGAIAGLCPTTEANLGDGIFNAREFLEEGGMIAVGSDSNISVSVAEELRQLEYSQRLRLQARNVLAGGPNRSTGRTLFNAAATGGARALGQPQGAIAAGLRSDIVVLNQQQGALIGRTGDNVLDSWIFSGGNACVSDVFVAGEHLVRQGQHIDGPNITARYRKALESLKAKL
ncbi:MAG TPA: formimidoylglutamate deiminase [Aestuariivirgaceae bacterium]|nr:formimidoylglutamate deiminase [Aestuariivirgaceae bacterium]